MIDRIRKAAFWVWQNKERMVLLVMLGVLCYQVYSVFNPPAPPIERTLMPPKNSVEGVEASRLPPPVPLDPPLKLPGDYAGLYRQNPFWEKAGAQTGSGGPDFYAELLDIQDLGNRLRARIRTRTRTGWYDEGARFEELTLEQINKAEGYVVIYAESLGKRKRVSLSSGR